MTDDSLVQVCAGRQGRTSLAFRTCSEEHLALEVSHFGRHINLPDDAVKSSSNTLQHARVRLHERSGDTSPSGRHGAVRLPRKHHRHEVLLLDFGPAASLRLLAILATPDVAAMLYKQHRSAVRGHDVLPSESN